MSKPQTSHAGDLRLHDLETLGRLRASGALTEAEFEIQKAAILASGHILSDEHGKGGSDPVGTTKFTLKIFAALAVVIVAGLLLYQPAEQQGVTESPSETAQSAIEEMAPPQPAQDSAEGATAANEQSAEAPVRSVSQTMSDRDAISAAIRREPAVARVEELENQCRGGDDETPKREEICAARDASYAEAEKAGFCYGYGDEQSTSEMRWRRC